MAKKSLKESLPPDDPACPECGNDHVVRDDNRGEVLCDACGLVLSDRAIDAGPEWSAFSFEENDRLARTGPPRDVLRGASGLATVIPYPGKDARGHSIPHDQRTALIRMRKLQYLSGQRTSWERNAPSVTSVLARIISRLDLPISVEEEAKFICRRALKRHLARGRSTEEIVAATVYVACRIHGVPRTLDELGGVTGLPKKSIGRTYRILHRSLNLPPAPLPRATDYVDRFCWRLDLSNTVRVEALRILEQLEGIGERNALAPAGTAAAAIYVASLSGRETRSQKAVAEASGVTGVTIRSRLRDLKRFGDGSLELPRGLT